MGKQSCSAYPYAAPGAGHADGPDRAPGQGHRWRASANTRVGPRHPVAELVSSARAVPRLLSSADSLLGPPAARCRPQGGGRRPVPTGGPARGGVTVEVTRPRGVRFPVAAGLRTQFCCSASLVVVVSALVVATLAWLPWPWCRPGHPGRRPGPGRRRCRRPGSGPRRRRGSGWRAASSGCGASRHRPTRRTARCRSVGEPGTWMVTSSGAARPCRPRSPRRTRGPGPGREPRRCCPARGRRCGSDRGRGRRQHRALHVVATLAGREEAVPDQVAGAHLHGERPGRRRPGSAPR